jgi:hypothetical protein
MTAHELTSRKAKAVDTAVSRRVGYSVAVLANALLFYLVNIWPGWAAVPFLTEETLNVLVLFNVSLVAAMVVQVANLIVDLRWVRAAGEIVTSAIALLFTIQLWNVFPFAFDTAPIDWALVARVLLAFAVGGCVVSIIVQLVALSRTMPAAHNHAPAHREG